MPWIRHDSHEQTTIKNRQALGAESPLETDDDGFAEVEDGDAAELLAALDTHVTFNPARAEREQFDAAAFVDRTPMDAVISDIESGEYDEHLNAIEDEASREGVQDAIDRRRE